MKDSPTCPENLVTERLSPHLQTCRSCRGELDVAQAFKREFTEYVGAPELGDRVAAGALAELARSSRVPWTPRRQPFGAGWYLFAAALLLVSLAAIAATHPTLRWQWHSSQLSLAGSSAVRVEPESMRPSPGAPPIEKAIAERVDQAPASPPVGAAIDPPSTPARSAGIAAGDPAPSARDLFASATRARHDDRGSRASALYRELQRRYPTSAEALVSRVSFGRVLLDRLDDPAGALAQFDGYLAQATHTALAEEALFGRASALAQLGRADEERETWRTLLTRYPSSVYADRARVRMGSIQ